MASNMSSHQVCKFFLQGNCKYGDKCWYLHQNPKSGGGSFGAGRQQSRGGGGGGWRSNSEQQQQRDKYHWQKGDAAAVPTHNRFGALKHESGGNSSGRSDKKETFEIMESIKHDIEEWEKSHMWPLSAYAPRNSAPLPGLEDYSPEEMRFEAYKEGNFQNYARLVSQLLDTVKKRKRELKHPDPSLKAKLASFIMGNGQNDKQGLFALNSSQASFITGSSSSNQPQPGFGGFGSQSSAVAAVGFGGLDVSSTRSEAMASGRATTNFGSSAVGASGTTGFVSPSTVTTTQASGTAAFGASQMMATGFGLAKASSGAAPSGFGPPQTMATGIGSAQSGNTFSFGSIGTKPKVAPTSSFGQSDALSTNFGNESKDKGGGLFGGSKPIDPSLYTPINELTAEEKEQFEAKHFTIGKVPTRPPPIELI